MNEKEKQESKKKLKGEKLIKPLKDFKCQFNGVLLDLKEGEEASVPEVLLANLKTEKVIK